MKVEFKRVPALDKGFAILELLAGSQKPLGISDISKALGFHKSTVFNLAYTLADLGILEHGRDHKFRFGLNLYALGKAAGGASGWVESIRPYLEDISAQTKLSVFLGIRSDLRAVIVDKVDTPFDIKIASETGMRIPLLAGAGGKVLLSQLADGEIDRILSEKKLRKFTAASCTNKRQYKEMLRKAREERFAMDNEEYIEGIRALAVPLRLNRGHLVAAIWIVGLKNQIKDDVIPSYRAMLQETAEKIETRFSLE
jgi:IclR family KDG regulon transcriptional repressor